MGRRFAPSSGLTSGYPGLSVRTRQAPGTPGTALAHFRRREPSRVRLTLSAILPSDRALARPVCLTFTTTGRAGPIVRGVPCSDFAVLGTDRLESNPRAPSPETCRGSSGACTTDRAPPEAPAGHRHSRAGDARARPGHREVLRELTTPVEASGLDVDGLVERTATAAPGSAARRTGAGEARPGGQSGQRRGGHPAEGREGHPRPAAPRSAGCSSTTTGRRDANPRRGERWPGPMLWIPSYEHGPFSSAAALFGYSIRDPRGLVRHVPRVIEARHPGGSAAPRGSQNPLVGGPVNTVLIDAKGARCAPAGSPGGWDRFTSERVRGVD